MKLQNDLHFFEQLLKNFHLPYQYVSYPFDSTSEIDLGLRKIINPNADFADFTEYIPKDIDSRKFYYVYDKYGCNYIFFQIPESSPVTLLFIGPYLLAPTSKEKICTLTKKYALSPTLLAQIEKYYHSLPLLPSHSILLTLVITLGEKLWGNIENFSMEEVHQTLFPGRVPNLDTPPLCDLEDPIYTIKLLEDRYEAEQNFIRAVSQGQLLKAQLHMPKFSTANLEQRTTDSIRNLKNYTIILNTLLRKAAEMGSVHPFHIDNLSSRFARKIETITSEKEAQHLQQEMVHKYCLLVQNHSIRGYSPLIQKVITQIDADLTADLSLKTLSALLNINSSYLSTLFKKETGSTLTEYVNRKRIEHALQLLNSTNMQIQTVAQHCGVSDVNYFTKLFKKQIGKTPKEYREDVIH